MRERGNMKAKDIIKSLSNLDPEEKVMIVYWTRDCVQDWFDEEDQIITDEIWNEAVEEFDEYEFQETNDMILDSISERVSGRINNEV